MKYAALMLASVVTTTANAKILPDAVDLKAAYCIPVLQDSVRLGGDLEKMPEPFRAEMRLFREKAASDLRRLQLYLLPRLELLETDSLLMASQSAKEDQARAISDVEQCMAKPSAEMKACAAAPTEAQTRVRSCQNLNFLPF